MPGVLGRGRAFENAVNPSLEAPHRHPASDGLASTSPTQDTLSLKTMPFLQLTFDIAARDAEAAEAACLEAGALSVTLLDGADAPILEPAPGETPLWARVRFAALFAQDVDRDCVDRALTTVLGALIVSAQWDEI